MSKPMTATQMLAQFKKFGLSVSEHAGWKTHNRNSGHTWGDVHGVVVHHTGSTASDASMREYCYNGDSGRGLPGPLCNWMIGKDGKVYMLGNGRANHAGMGSSTTYHHVLNEDYSISTDLKPGPDDMDGNAVYYGFETNYSGASAPPQTQFDAMVKVAAAVCDFHGWSAKSVLGHKEHTRRKDDPGHVDMSDFRKAVQALLDKHADGATSGKLTAAQVLQLALDAGFTRTQANMMTVISYYESGWDPRNLGDATLSKYGSRGLWQIFTGAHNPKEVGIGTSTTWTDSTAEQLYDPVKNAHAAHVVYGEQGYTAWSVYKNRAQHSGWDNLLSEVSAIELDAPAPAPAPTPKPEPVVYDEPYHSYMTPGGRGPANVLLKRYLRLCGYYTGFTTSQLRDDYYGSGTEQGVAAFYRANRSLSTRTNDIWLGPKGWAELQKEAAAIKNKAAGL